MKISYLADNPKDAKLIAKWYFDEWGHTIPSITEEMVLKKVSLKAKNRIDFPLIITIHENQDLVAAAELKFREHIDYPQYEHWVGGVYVVKNKRGKGYAKALVSKAQEHVAALKIEHLYLQCEDHNKGLYEKLGFKPIHAAVHNGVETTIYVYKATT
ncbi:GNAT family N-acetyltransferase [Simiduia aestuariiviva]|uniref:Putative hydrolase of the HAD superfamily n=1 Tax=Simiduia aestuariiviva TaxID=1510459 RepID=A0A839UJQ1_9GAMM|nr:GNAT family N-acetyltransferase [Simiduia aestuariiviva]MBB3166839.1 putative hydrolase of the HAD superfamily [Simiduia aestuariiviva]